MRNVNQVTINGNVVRDAELTKTTNSCVAKFSIANNRDYGETKIVNFFDCEAWGNLGEKIVMPYVKKGTKVTIVGELRQNTYKDKDGKTVSKVSIVVNDIELNSKASTPSEPTTDTSTDFGYTEYPEF